MCTDCNEITIPTGPKGDTGATGATGPAGADGSNGADGTNGTTVLSAYNSITGIGTPASLTETTLFTYNVSANTLATNGDELEAFIYYEYTASDSVTFRIKLGSKIHTFTEVAANNYVGIIKIKIARISSTSQFWTIEKINKSSTSIIPVFTGLVIDSSTVNLATILAFEVSGENSVANANQLVLKKCVLYKYIV